MNNNSYFSMPVVNKFTPPMHTYIKVTEAWHIMTFISAEDPVTRNQIPLSVVLQDSVISSGLTGHHSSGVSAGHSAWIFPTTFIMVSTSSNLLPMRISSESWQDLRFCLGAVQTSIIGQTSTFLWRNINHAFPLSLDMSQAIYALFGFIMEK